MPSAPPPVTPALCVLLAFNASTQLAVRRAGTRLGHAFVGADEAMAQARLAASFPDHTPPAEYFTYTGNGPGYRVFFTQVNGTPADGEVDFRTLDQLQAAHDSLAPAPAGMRVQLDPYL